MQLVSIFALWLWRNIYFSTPFPSFHSSIHLFIQPTTHLCMYLFPLPFNSVQITVFSLLWFLLGFIYCHSGKLALQEKRGAFSNVLSLIPNSSASGVLCGLFHLRQGRIWGCLSTFFAYVPYTGADYLPDDITVKYTYCSFVVCDGPTSC